MPKQTAQPKGNRKPKLVVALDGDRLGSVAGALSATLVMALCFFYREMSLGPAIVRAGWVFVIAYGAVFFWVRVMLRTTLIEFAHHTRDKRARLRREKSEATKKLAEEAGVLPLSSAMPQAPAD